VLFTDGVDNQLEGPNSEGSTTPFAVVYRRIQEVDSSVYAVFLEPKIPQRSSGQKPSRDIRAISPGIGWPTSRPEPPPRPSSSTVCEMARDQLQRIATQTGGRMRSLTRVEDIGHVYAEIAEELQYQYQLGYNPTNTEHDGKWRQIHVEVRNRPDVSIRTRRGYYVSGPELR
jgi:VWFA-related protein